MPSQTGLKPETRITCPECGHIATATMATDACRFFHDRKGCGAVPGPLPGDCCVYGSCATVPCPPVQAGRGCC